MKTRRVQGRGRSSRNRYAFRIQVVCPNALLLAGPRYRSRPREMRVSGIYLGSSQPQYSPNRQDEAAVSGGGEPSR